MGRKLVTPEALALISKIMGQLEDDGPPEKMAEDGKELAIQLQQDMETRELGIVLHGLCTYLASAHERLALREEKA